MLQSELIICVGAPCSGKTTWSRDFVKKNKDYVRVNKDDLRLMLQDTQIMSGDNENILSEIVIEMVETLLIRGCNVILDNTNCRFKYIQNWTSFNVSTKLKIFNPDLEVLLERNQLRTKDKIPEEVIRYMHSNLQEMIGNKLLDDYVKI